MNAAGILPHGFQFHRHRRLAVFGGPGTGKTVLLKRIAVLAAAALLPRSMVLPAQASADATDDVTETSRLALAAQASAVPAALLL